MKIRMLYSSREIKLAIKEIFKSNSQRRVAIAAFVGDEAHAYLSNPKNLELYCWAKAGGTNPVAIRKLILRGAKVYFSDSLHMKLYWSNKGAVITSANLSTFALGSGGLKEIGVLLPSASVKIDKIIKSLGAQIASEEKISYLEAEHKKTIRTNPNLIARSDEKYTFEKWYAINYHKKIANWKIACFSFANIRLAKKSGQVLEKEHGNKSYEDILETFSNEYFQDDWLLCYQFNGKQPVQIGWLYAHHVIKSSRSVKGKTKSFYQIIQVNKLKAYDKPPFEIDAAFKKAFVAAHKEYYGDNEDKMEDEYIPTRKILDLISVKLDLI